jgi:hypothetical protein
VLPAINSTGIKIKLLQALYNGRFVLTNPPGIAGIGLENICRLAGTAAEFKKTIKELLAEPFTETDRAARAAVLEGVYDNAANAQTLMQWIW